MRTYLLATAFSLFIVGGVFAVTTITAPEAHAYESAFTEIKNKLQPLGTTYGFGTEDIFRRNTQTIIIGRVAQIIRIALTFLGVIFIALTLYAGFLWMTAAGNDEQIENSRKVLRAAVIGLVIIIVSYGFSAFLIRALLRAAT